MTSTPFMTSVRFVKLAVLAPVALTMAACAGPAEKGFVQADANTIRQRTQEFKTAFNTKDAVKVATFYPGEGVLMPPNAPTIRGREEIQKFYRLFMVPGMAHCAGGVGPDRNDAVTAVIDWVEKGKAPDELIASKVTEGKVVRTRPLCPYPQVARYKGQGSIDDAANFSCVAPR